jgi:hypothetical protein
MSGTLLFRGNNYTIQGDIRDGALSGVFSDGDQAWPFSVRSDGDNLTFTAGSFTTQLQRQNLPKLPKLEGVYASKRVKLQFQNKDGGINGVITFNGKQFQFTAAELAGELEGVFKSGNEAFKFTLANEPGGLAFQTGKFSETVRFLATAFSNAARWTNSLGMVLVGGGSP